MPSRAQLDLRAYEPGDETAIRQLFQATYARDMSEAYWSWRFAHAPAGPGVITLAWDGSVLAAHYGVTPLELSVRGRTVGSGLSGTTMTHPAYRGLGLFPLLAQATYAQMRQRGHAHVWGFPNAKSHRGFVETVGWSDIYQVPFLECDLSALQHMPKCAVSIERVTRADGRFDDLWRRISCEGTIRVVRDSRYLNWRFCDNPADTYTLLVANSGSSIDGYVAWKRYEDAVQIVDVTCVSCEVALSLVSAVLEASRDEGVRKANLWLNVTAPLHRLLERHGFVPVGPVTYFGGLSFDSHEQQGFYEYKHWCLAMSDSDVY